MVSENQNLASIIFKVFLIANSIYEDGLLVNR